MYVLFLIFVGNGDSLILSRNGIGD